MLLSSLEEFDLTRFTLSATPSPPTPPHPIQLQVGCARACSFCATGTIGLKENLPASSILEQFLHAQLLLASKDIPASSLTNVVFMGQGEPLDNYGEVLKSLRGLTHQCLFNLSPSRITVSTVAPVPSIIKRLADDAPAVNLAMSLHGATQELRELTVPSARGTSIEEVRICDV